MGTLSTTFPWMPSQNHGTHIMFPKKTWDMSIESWNKSGVPLTHESGQNQRPNQSGYKQGRSTKSILWPHKGCNFHPHMGWVDWPLYLDRPYSGVNVWRSKDMAFDSILYIYVSKCFQSWTWLFFSRCPSYTDINSIAKFFNPFIITMREYIKISLNCHCCFFYKKNLSCEWDAIFMCVHVIYVLHC
jgi:hypothetical protein